jgi:hypothetical protein
MDGNLLEDQPTKRKKQEGKVEKGNGTPSAKKNSRELLL